jgi:hypothetical protein
MPTSYSLKISSLLLTLALPVLLVSGSYDMHSVARYAMADLFISGTNDMYTPVIFDNVFDIFGGKPLEHLVEIDANQIFPNQTLKNEMINRSGSLDFTMPVLNYDLLGFNISASDIEVNATTKQVIDDSSQSKKTRIDFPVMLARNVNVSNGIISQKYEDVDLSSIYAFYDSQTDKFTFHVPYDIAARYLLN